MPRYPLAQKLRNEEVRRKPDWLKVKLPTGSEYTKLHALMSQQNLHTVCEEAHCPNISECWNGGTATIMLMGDMCTRSCRFCMVKSGNPHGVLDPLEPIRVGEAIAELDLTYVVLTSVDRDDLSDGGASHFSKTVKEIKNRNSQIIIEVLISDFQGDLEALKVICNSNPSVISHNIETTRSLSPKVRDPRAGYDQSLRVLGNIKSLSNGIFTKSSIMLGLGESYDEICTAMHDLRAANVDILTLGQYLQPSRSHLPVKEFITPDLFDNYRTVAEHLGFLYVAAGPLVRSSYRTGEFFTEKVIRGNAILETI